MVIEVPEFHLFACPSLHNKLNSKNMRKYKPETRILLVSFSGKEFKSHTQ